MLDQLPEQLSMWVLPAGVAIAVGAAAWTAMTRPSPRATLPLEHVAGAAIIGLLGWEAVVALPGFVAGYASLTVDIGEFEGVRAHLAQVAGLAAFAIGAAVAVVGILRRRPWAIVLGIGLSAVRAATTIASLITLWILTGEAIQVGGGGYFEYAAPMLALQIVPPLVAIGLLVWPLVRGSAGTEAAPPTADDPEWRGRAAPADHAR
jgi:hypothetical protein